MFKNIKKISKKGFLVTTCKVICINSNEIVNNISIMFQTLKVALFYVFTQAIVRINFFSPNQLEFQITIYNLQNKTNNITVISNQINQILNDMWLKLWHSEVETRSHCTAYFICKGNPNIKSYFTDLQRKRYSCLPDSSAVTTSYQ